MSRGLNVDRGAEAFRAVLRMCLRPGRPNAMRVQKCPAEQARPTPRPALHPASADRGWSSQSWAGHYPTKRWATERRGKAGEQCAVTATAGSPATEGTDTGVGTALPGYCCGTSTTPAPGGSCCSTERTGAITAGPGDCLAVPATVTRAPRRQRCGSRPRRSVWNRRSCGSGPPTGTTMVAGRTSPLPLHAATDSRFNQLEVKQPTSAGCSRHGPRPSLCTPAWRLPGPGCTGCPAVERTGQVPTTCPARDRATCPRRTSKVTRRTSRAPLGWGQPGGGRAVIEPPVGSARSAASRQVVSSHDRVR